MHTALRWRERPTRDAESPELPSLVRRQLELLGRRSRPGWAAEDAGARAHVTGLAHSGLRPQRRGGSRRRRVRGEP